MNAAPEFVLQSYGPNDGPEYPTGRRKGETVSVFIRRKQAQEKQALGKGIFAPVNLSCAALEDQRRRYAAHLRALYRTRIDARDPQSK